jgi:hypothetical protein
VKQIGLLLGLVWSISLCDGYTALLVQDYCCLLCPMIWVIGPVVELCRMLVAECYSRQFGFGECGVLGVSVGVG